MSIKPGSSKVLGWWEFYGVITKLQFVWQSRDDCYKWMWFVYVWNHICEHKRRHIGMRLFGFVLELIMWKRTEDKSQKYDLHLN